MPLAVVEFQVADPADVWRLAGFDVGADSVCRIGGVGIRLTGRGHGAGIIGWSLAGLPADSVIDDIDGVPTTQAFLVDANPGTHPNGVVAVDHVVLSSPDLDRTVRALAAVGAEPRRQRDGDLGGTPMRQVFYRFGEVIVEVVGSAETTGEGPATPWGLTFTVRDIDETAAFFGDHTAAVKQAVQPGRRITTLRHRDLGMSVRTALISTPIL